MKRPELDTLENSDLNPFLFSVIGPEQSGAPVSVVSLLARLGSDPWWEAGRLADLPKEAARDWLAQKIASTPTGTWSLSDAAIIAIRLVALLPVRIRGQMPPVSLPWSGRSGAQKGATSSLILALCGAAIFAFVRLVAGLFQ